MGTNHGLNRLDRSTGRSSHFRYDPKNPRSLGHDYVGSILEDRSGILWVGTVFGEGLSAFDVKTQEFTRYSQEDPRTATVTQELAGLYTELAEMMKV